MLTGTKYIFLLPIGAREQKSVPSPLQKISQQIMSMLGQNRLRMKLHAFDIQGFVPDAHDFIQFAGFILCPGGYFQAIGQGGLFDDQGMITGGGERIGKPFEHAEIVMINR